MGRFIPGFNYQEEKDIHLVALGVKPASTVSLQALLLHNEERICRGQQPNSPATIVTLTADAIRQTEYYFSTFGVLYKTIKRAVPDGNDVCYESVSYAIAKTSTSLRQLEQALAREDTFATRITLGFPEDACQVFCRTIDGEKRNGRYVFTQIDRARAAGLSIPDWVLYLDHIPAEIDLVAGHISTESKMRAEVHLTQLRNTNPILAQEYEHCERTRIFNL